MSLSLTTICRAMSLPRKVILISTEIGIGLAIYLTMVSGRVVVSNLMSRAVVTEKLALRVIVLGPENLTSRLIMPAFL